MMHVDRLLLQYNHKEGYDANQVVCYTVNMGHKYHKYTIKLCIT